MFSCNENDDGVWLDFGLICLNHMSQPIIASNFLSNRLLMLFVVTSLFKQKKNQINDKKQCHRMKNKCKVLVTKQTTKCKNQVVAIYPVQIETATKSSQTQDAFNRNCVELS